MKIRGGILLLTILAACSPKQPERAGNDPDPSATAAQDGERSWAQDWSAYRGDLGSRAYSKLDEINRSNVGDLQVAWVYHTGDRRVDPPSTIECNPIVVNGVLYATSPRLKVFALDAATGKELWTFDPFADGEARGVNRGVMYWQSPDGGDERILFTAGSKLYALDAATGKQITSFGANGTVDLREGLGLKPSSVDVTASSPGVIYHNLLILGSSVREGPGAVAPGDIRAYDVRSGEQMWSFHTIPGPGEFGSETWPKNARQQKNIGGANAWAGMSLDPERGMVFVPTGSATYDFYGGNRKGKNLFANTLLALDAATGERIWHFQAVHHDLLDRDLPAPPNLVTVRHDGQRVEAVAQITKTGHVFLLNRATGEPLFPIEEQSVPASRLPGEAAAPTQPLPDKPSPFVRQTYTRDDLPTHSPEARAYAAKRFGEVHSGGPFAPPSRGGTLVFPGFNGGGEWSGASFDPATGKLYVNAQELPWILKMVRPQSASAGANAYVEHCASCHGVNRQGGGPYPSLADVGKRLSRKKVERTIRNGQGQMPAFKNNLSKEEMEALLSFLFDKEEGSFDTAETDNKEAEISIPFVHTGWNRFVGPDGYPAVKPPWGTLSAIDLNAGEIAWQVPLGNHEELSRQGDTPTGTENIGGAIVTAGGLVFVGATTDEKFRAFDKATGEVLWETMLPAGGYATPATYEAAGRQYVVIAAGGGGKPGTASGDAYVAFALPHEAQ